MQKIPYMTFIILVNNAIDDIRSGYDFEDYMANTAIQEILKVTKLNKETLEMIWNIAKNAICIFSDIQDDIDKIIDSDVDNWYEKITLCTKFLSIKCIEE